MVKKRTLAFATLAILVWAISVTSLFGYYYLRFQEYVDLAHEYEAVTMRVNIAIDYGNDTKTWHNNTIVPLGATLLNATEFVADVDGAPFVNAIDGVALSSEEKMSWLWWRWDAAISGWILGEVGADKHLLRPREILVWAYQSWETWPPPPPS